MILAKPDQNSFDNLDFSTTLFFVINIEISSNFTARLVMMTGLHSYHHISLRMATILLVIIRSRMLQMQVSIALIGRILEADNGCIGANGAEECDFCSLPLCVMREVSKVMVFHRNARYHRDEYMTRSEILLELLGTKYKERKELPAGTIRKMDAFELLRLCIEAISCANIVTVGYFSHIERIAECTNLTMLEQNCYSELNMPNLTRKYIVLKVDFHLFDRHDACRNIAGYITRFI